jgi:hypothetical protein
MKKNLSKNNKFQTSKLSEKKQRLKRTNAMDTTMHSMLIHSENDSFWKVIKSFQHLHTNLNLNDNQILQQFFKKFKRSQIVRNKVTKTLLPITKYLNDIKDTPKYRCVCCQILQFQYQSMELPLTFLKIIRSIIPINKTLQHDNMFICKSCKQLINIKNN